MEVKQRSVLWNRRQNAHKETESHHCLPENVVAATSERGEGEYCCNLTVTLTLLQPYCRRPTGRERVSGECERRERGRVECVVSEGELSLVVIEGKRQCFVVSEGERQCVVSEGELSVW